LGISLFSFYEFDQEFQVTKKFKVPNSPIAFTIHLNDRMENEIFCLTHGENQLLKLNENFELMKSLTKNDKILFKFSETYENFWDIGSDKNSLYMIDRQSKFIYRLTFDLVPLDKIKIDCNPITINVSEKTICVLDSDYNIYFYDIQTQKLKKVHITFFEFPLKISNINNKFYIISAKNKKIICFNDEATKTEEFSFGDNLKKYIKDDNDGNLVFDNRFLYCSSFHEKCILKFNIL
jgi:hypothetical protein